MSVDLLVEGDTVRVYNVHLSSIGFEKEDYEAARNVGDEQNRSRLFARLSNAMVQTCSAGAAGSIERRRQSVPSGTCWRLQRCTRFLCRGALERYLEGCVRKLPASGRLLTWEPRTQVNSRFCGLIRCGRVLSWRYFLTRRAQWNCRITVPFKLFLLGIRRPCADPVLLIAPCRPRAWR